MLVEEGEVADEEVLRDSIVIEGGMGLLMGLSRMGIRTGIPVIVEETNGSDSRMSRMGNDHHTTITATLGTRLTNCMINVVVAPSINEGVENSKIMGVMAGRSVCSTQGLAVLKFCYTCTCRAESGDLSI